jgi:NAD kinase
MPAVSKDEQIAFMRVAQRVIACMKQKGLSARDHSAMLAELDQLANLTGYAVTGSSVVRNPPSRVRVPVEVGQEIDLDQLKHRLRRRLASEEVDVIFTVGGDSYEVWLEHIPGGRTAFRSDADWLG